MKTSACCSGCSEACAQKRGSILVTSKPAGRWWTANVRLRAITGRCSIADDPRCPLGTLEIKAGTARATASNQSRQRRDPAAVVLRLPNRARGHDRRAACTGPRSRGLTTRQLPSGRRYEPRWCILRRRLILQSDRGTVIPRKDRRLARPFEQWYRARGRRRIGLPTPVLRRRSSRCSGAYLGDEPLGQRRLRCARSSLSLAAIPASYSPDRLWRTLACDMSLSMRDRPRQVSMSRRLGCGRSADEGHGAVLASAFLISVRTLLVL